MNLTSWDREPHTHEEMDDTSEAERRERGGETRKDMKTSQTEERKYDSEAPVGTQTT